MSKNKNEKEMKEMSNFITEYLNSLSDETKEGIFLTAINNYLDEEIKYFDDCEEEQKEIMELYKNFKSADEVGKRVIIDAVLKNILISVSFFNQTYLESQCKRFRHRYGDWEEYEKTHEEKMDYYPYYSHKVVDESGWRKVCSRCGKVYETQTEPTKLRRQREKEERESRRKKLQRELDKLEEEEREASAQAKQKGKRR